jgi:hypothetical protein
VPRHSVNNLDGQECIAVGSIEQLPDARVKVGSEAIPRNVENCRVGQRAESDVFNVNTIGGADGKTDLVRSTRQHPHEGGPNESRDQRPQSISANSIGLLHVVDRNQQALPISQPGEMACDAVDEQQWLRDQRVNLLEFGLRQEGITARA